MSNLEQEPNEEENQGHGPWPVELGENQEPIGLPGKVKRKNVILRLKNLEDPKNPKRGWEAVNPTKEDIEEQINWRGDMAA